ncbi:hypothetical protein [Photobacterium sp. J15]|uniref:hypothetical protein n=1 Tax=Photobacterium sp. J15 TaxID=265901 RepID=UPI0007E33CF4|nr:hypothetical protein [Photobacterium sp. J15]
MKQKNTLPLQPLTREYFSVKRAAALLDLEVEDFIHWAAVGSIRACVKISAANTSEAKLSFVPGGFNKESFFKRVEEFSASSKLITFGAGIARFFSTPDGYLEEDNMPFFNGVPQGIWQISIASADNIESVGSADIDFLKPLGLIREEGIAELDSIEFIEPITVTVDDLVVIAEDVDKIRTVISQNKPIPNLYNCDKDGLFMYSDDDFKTESDKESLKKDYIIAMLLNEIARGSNKFDKNHSANKGLGQDAIIEPNVEQIFEHKILHRNLKGIRGLGKTNFSTIARNALNNFNGHS